MYKHNNQVKQATLCGNLLSRWVSIRGQIKFCGSLVFIILYPEFTLYCPLVRHSTTSSLSPSCNPQKVSRCLKSSVNLGISQSFINLLKVSSQSWGDHISDTLLLRCWAIKHRPENKSCKLLLPNHMSFQKVLCYNYELWKQNVNLEKATKLW